jgi:hypothetical protein
MASAVPMHRRCLCRLNDPVGRPAQDLHWRCVGRGCGTGVVARVAAERVGRTGRVGGTDINAAMLGVAPSVRVGAGARIGWSHEMTSASHL